MRFMNDNVICKSHAMWVILNDINEIIKDSFVISH